jgi:hypothetical protein
MGAGAGTLKRAIAAGALLLAATPAAAERVETYWRLEPVVAEAPTRVKFGDPFFDQRLLPVRLVELTENLAVGGKTLPAGTLLYLVFNADRKIGYCTIKDRSLGNQARTLFIPILDQRPCLVDKDGDGRFDASFSVFDKYGGLPSARGSLNGATPLPVTAGYRQVDVHKFPDELIASLVFQGSHDAAKAKLGIEFSRSLVATWPAVKGEPDGAGSKFALLNTQVRLLAVNGDTADLELRWTDELYLSTDNGNTLYWSRLPPFVPSDYPASVSGSGAPR